MTDDYIRIGTISDIDSTAYSARVYFPDTKHMSGWLKMVKTFSSVPAQTELAEGGTGETAYEAHVHTLTAAYQVPNIGDTVLCIYKNGFNNDGYILGVL